MHRFMACVWRNKVQFVILPARFNDGRRENWDGSTFFGSVYEEAARSCVCRSILLGVFHVSGDPPTAANAANAQRELYVQESRTYCTRVLLAGVCVCALLHVVKRIPPSLSPQVSLVMLRRSALQSPSYSRGKRSLVVFVSLFPLFLLSFSSS